MARKNSSKTGVVLTQNMIDTLPVLSFDKDSLQAETTPEGWDESATGETDDAQLAALNAEAPIVIGEEEAETLSEIITKDLEDADTGILTPAEQAAVSLLEAFDDEVSEDEVQEDQASEESFTDIVASLDDPAVSGMIYAVADEMDARLEFEKEKSLTTGKDNIFKNLDKSRAKMIRKYVAQTLLATQVDPVFINRTLNEGSKYSVYALNKLEDIANAAVNGQMTNAINLNICKSLFALKRLGHPMTMELAKAACSKQYRVDSPLVKHLTRHTVSVSTVSTQSSSTMQALQTLGVVRLVGSRRGATYEVTDTPIAKRLEEVLMAA